MADAHQIAHLYRRTGFAVPPDAFRRHSGDDIHDLIDARLEDEGWALDVAEAAERDFEDVEWYTLPSEWMERIMQPEAGLHERMVWFWHGHFTTNRSDTNHRDIWRQHHLIRRHAMGNVKELARELITDAAMLHFLDGAGSRGDAPNENFSREFMELFVLGRNAGYTEDDVRAGARIVSGWSVDWETGAVEFNPDHHYDRPVSFLGTRQRWTLDSYVDALFSMPSAAGHIAAAVHAELVSTPLTNDRRDALGEVLRSNDWEIKPLLADMLHHDDFTSAAGRRSRQPVEWLAGATMAFGIRSFEERGLEFWHMGETGQVPFEPPNVGGWPNDDRWSSASQVVSRGNALVHWELSDTLIDRIEPTPAAVLAHCGVAEATDETVGALQRAIDTQTEYDHGLELLLTLALLSPEFAVV